MIDAIENFIVRVIGAAGTTKSPLPYAIRDSAFTTRLTRLCEAREFLYLHGVISVNNLLPGHDLNCYPYNRLGDKASEALWKQLEEAEAATFSQLSDDLLFRYRAWKALSILRTPTISFGGATLLLFVFPILPATVSYLISLLFGTEVISLAASVDAFPTGLFYVIWLIAFGGLGGCASLAVNALLIQRDVGFDFSRRKAVALRLITGCIFSFIFCVLLSYDSYDAITRFLALGAKNPQSTDLDATDTARLLMPFLVGFSTALVLTILNRLVASVQTLFGPSR